LLEVETRNSIRKVVVGTHEPMTHVITWPVAAFKH